MTPELPLPKGDEEAVKAVWPDAELVGYHNGACAIFSREAARTQDTGYMGWGQTTFDRSSTQANREAWADARSKLPKPEGETTLPALGIDIKDYNRSNGHVEFRQEELEIREAQLLAALRDLKTVLDRESASTARFDAKITALEAERDALKAELLLHVNRTLRNAVVGQETAEQAFERGQRVMRDYLASQFDSQMDFASPAGSLRHCLEFPYTPPLKAGQ